MSGRTTRSLYNPSDDGVSTMGTTREVYLLKRGIDRFQSQKRSKKYNNKFTMEKSLRYNKLKE